MERRYITARGKTDLDGWMRDEQGWTLAADAEGIRDNLERAAKFSCYALVNRLVFYEALMKRYGAQLKKLNLPEHIDSGEGLRLHLEGFFAEAKKVTGDYQTVFGEDHFTIGSRIPFYSDHPTRYWRVKKEADATLSGRSDLHCYFWPHAFTFLKPEGWVCLLTSSQWLDVEYASGCRTGSFHALRLLQPSRVWMSHGS